VHRASLEKRLAEIGSGKMVGPDVERTTMQEIFAMVEDRYITLRRRSLDRVKRSLKHLGGFFGGARVGDQTEDRIRAYVRHRQERNAADATINRELAAMKLAFRLGERAGKVGRRPHIEMLTEPPPRRGFFEEEGFRAVLEGLPEEIKPIAEFMYVTGWRKNEVLSLQWRQVDLKGGVIRLDVGTTKSGEGRVLPFCALPDLAELIHRQRERTTALERIVPWVFHRNGERVRDFRGAWKTACAAAGLPGRIPHDFRRTAARNLVRAGVPERVAMEILGHKTRSIFDRYNIVNDADIAEGLAKLGAKKISAGRETK
jgi:integrase